MAVSNLHLFCESICRKYSSPGRASEEDKADEFRKAFFRNLRLTMKSVSAVAGACGIKLDSLDEETMPRKVRGYHEIHGDCRNIYVRKDDTVSGTMNTILHEIREMMESVFAEICPSYNSLKTSARHIAANRFATAVLLPRKEFTEKAYETGFDIIELANHYSKSCSQVLLRLGEILKGKLFFYGALYEPAGGDDDGWQVTYWTRSTNEQDPEANVYGLNSFFPRKGRKMETGSLVDMAIKEGKPHLARHIIVLDDEMGDGLTAIASPLMIENYPVKVTLLILMWQDSNLLEPMIERLQPVEVEGISQHL